jgi:hypothetical protein
VNAARLSRLPLLCYYGVQSSMSHVERICGEGGSCSSVVEQVLPTATLMNHWLDRGREAGDMAPSHHSLRSPFF